MAKVLIVTRNYPPVICGVGDHSTHLKKEWEAIGHEVFILTEGNPANNCPGIYYTDTFDRRLRDVLTGLLVKYSINIIFWQYVPYSYHKKGLPVWLPGVMRTIQKKGVRQLLYFHEVCIRIKGHGQRHRLAGWLQRNIARSAIKIADTAFTNVPLYQAYFKNKKPRLLPVGSNIPAPFNPVAIVPGRIVCFANRADPALFQAVSYLKKETTVELVICGACNKERMQVLDRWIKQFELEDIATITNALPAEKLGELIASAAIFFQPQLVEKNNEGGISGKNGTIMAAMEMGKAIITCRGDMTDPLLFRNDDNLLFVPYGQADAYRNALHQLLENENLRQQLGTAAMETYHRYVNWHHVGKHTSMAFTPMVTHLNTDASYVYPE